MTKTTAHIYGKILRNALIESPPTRLTKLLHYSPLKGKGFVCDIFFISETLVLFFLYQRLTTVIEQTEYYFSLNIIINTLLERKNTSSRLKNSAKILLMI